MRRIALVLDRWDPRGGGLEQWAHALALRILRDGDEVHVVASRFAPAEGARPGDAAVVAHPLAHDASPLARAAAAEEALRSLDADVVHDLGVGWRYDVLQPQAGSRLANHLRDERTFPLWRRVLRRIRPLHRRRRVEMRALERRQYGEARGTVVAVSRLVEADLRERSGAGARPIEVVPNGVDTARFTPAHRAAHRERVRASLGVERETSLLLLAAHNLRLKGLAQALEALALVRSSAGARAPHLAVMGRGDPDLARRLTARLRLEGRVHLLGFVEDPVHVYAAADALVHPTFHDACSLVTLEAWASALPVVTTRHDGASELMAPGVEGLLLDDALDVRGLARHMEALQDPRRRERMGEAGRALAERNTLERNLDAVRAIHERAVRERCLA